MKKIILAIVPTLLLAACANDAPVYRTPGAPVDLVECDPNEICQ
jgi:hypothetical protein